MGLKHVWNLELIWSVIRYRQIGKHESVAGKTNHLLTLTLLCIFLSKWPRKNIFKTQHTLRKKTKKYIMLHSKFGLIIMDYFCNLSWFVLPSNDLCLPIWWYTEYIPLIKLVKHFLWMIEPMHNWERTKCNHSVKLMIDYNG